MEIVAHTSVSQVQLFRRCQRRYWYSYGPLHLKEEDTEALAFGKAVHARLEHYLKTGENVLGPVELPAFREGLLPAPKRADLLVEYHLETPDLVLAGVRVEGFADFIDLAKLPLEVEIGDHKTSSDPEKWGKKPHQLAEDVQGTVYAAYAFKRWNPERVRFRHVTYAKTKPYRAVPSETVFTVDRHPAKLLTIEHDVALSRVVLGETEPDNVPGTVGPESCHAFKKPCPHMAYCSAWRNRRGLISLSKSSGGTLPMPGLLAKLKNPTAALPDVSTPPPPAATAPAAEGYGKCDKCQAPRTKHVDGVIACVHGHDRAPPAIKSAAPAVGVVPPDAPPMDEKPPYTTPVAAPTTLPEASTAPDAAPSAPVVAEGTSSPPMSVGDTGTQAPVEEKPKRGRKAKAEAPAPPLASPPPVAPVILAGSVVDPDALILFIDTLPREAPHPVPLDREYIPTICAEAARQGGVDDYGLVEYGKGPGLVRALCRSAPPTGRVFIRTGWGAASIAVAEALRPLAKQVFEAVR